MKDLTGSLLGRVALRFDADAAYVPADLSAAMPLPGGGLIVAADELASLELLKAQPNKPHVYGAHQSYSLCEPLGLNKDEEIDIEGVTCAEDGAALFVIGSHSAKRKKPRGESQHEDLDRLATVQVEEAREVLARIPLVDGAPQLEKKGKSKVALLPSDGEDSLLALLADDPHLAPFVARDGGFTIPGKDNGFDIEGLACFQGRLLIGLRGPVLRGWAFVLDIELSVGADGVLGIAGKQRYRKHALQLDGLGVRELLVVGDDVLVLAGPTMTLDGSHRLFRWVGGPSGKKSTVVKREKKQLEPLFDLPFHPGFDRAEGVARFSWFDDDDSLLVVYDAPGKARRLEDCSVLADVFAL